MANAIANNTKFQHSREGRLGCLMMGGIRWMFQFTPLMRGATLYFFNSLSDASVSIHAPHARGDYALAGIEIPEEVSIHAPHARGDLLWFEYFLNSQGFNSRPSCEGRHELFGKNDQAFVFQFTPLMRGATYTGGEINKRLQVSIHAPHARGDYIHQTAVRHGKRFNSRPSCEGRRWSFRPLKTLGTVSIHAPHARGDRTCQISLGTCGCFNSRPSCEGRQNLSN